MNKEYTTILCQSCGEENDESGGACVARGAPLLGKLSEGGAAWIEKRGDRVAAATAVIS